MAATPLLSLDFYDFGTIMRKYGSQGVMTYAVSPQKIAAALATKITVETGLLPEGTLYFAQQGLTSIVIEYRKPQRTGVWVEGREDAYRIPMPGLVLVRVLRDGIPAYKVYAAKQRPMKLDDQLYVSVLPNTYSSGEICWGTVKRIGKGDVSQVNLAADWDLLLGAAFNNHSVSGKSKQHGTDIRKMYEALEAKKARTWPLKDMIPANLTFGRLLKGFQA